MIITFNHIMINQLKYQFIKQINMLNINNL